MDPFHVDGEVFDPFGLGNEAPPSRHNTGVQITISPENPPSVMRTSRSPPQENADAIHVKDRETLTPSGNTGPTPAIPPALRIKFSIHEEVTSIAKSGVENEGASGISVEGTVSAQINCSDAYLNSPFGLIASSFQGGSLVFRGSDEFVKSPIIPSELVHIVNIPKNEIGNVVIGRYTLNEVVQHMPILVERKLSIYGNVCRIMVQVRSKMTNVGDMEDFTIAVAIPERVDGETVKVLRGNGVWDELKRTIKWKLPQLTKGESFMVSASCELWAPMANEDDQVVFPVMMRCLSPADQISSVKFHAVDAEGYPATIQHVTVSSFRMLHRVP